MQTPPKNPSLIRDLNSPLKADMLPQNRFIPFLLGVIILGTLGGFLLSSFSKTSTKTNQAGSSNTTSKKTVGIADKKTFKDKAEGMLKEGGADGEGSFHLERPGGVSQNVYLTSTTVDLSGYVGKKVRVWGETFQAEKAGWLMDVGLVEVLQ